MIRIAVLGSTGSIGKSALEVVARHPDRFQVVGLAAHTRVDELGAQVARFGPRAAVVADERAVLPAAAGHTVWARGRQALLDMSRDPKAATLLLASGCRGFEPATGQDYDNVRAIYRALAP